MSDIVAQKRFLRCIGLAVEAESLRFSHDYGEISFPWDAIESAFAIIFKKKTDATLPFFIFIERNSQAYYYIDGNTISMKFLKSEGGSDGQQTLLQSQSLTDMKKSKEEEFKRIILEICSHLSQTYIDKPLVAYLKGNRFFLPEFATLKDVADYIIRVMGSITEEDFLGALLLKEEQDLNQVTTPKREREEWKPGTILEDTYTVQEVLRGGMGTVYIVFDSQNVDFYAMKTFQEAYLWNERVIQQFINEAEIWVKLEHHPHIVQARQVKVIEGKPYIMLEYILGTDLADLIEKKSLTMKKALTYAIQICDGMSYAFNKLGLIHRDIKPANCMITKEGVLKITDFGLGKLRSESKGAEGLSTDVTRRSTIKSAGASSTGMAGTLPFMAPELFSEANAAGIKSDIYAFGIVLYMMLTYVNPFYSEDPTDIISNHMALEPDDPSELNIEVPETLSRLVLRCLAKTQGERYDNFEEIKRSLEEIYRTTIGSEYVPLVIEEAFSEDDWLNKGSSLESLGRHKEAILTFDKVLSLNPESIRALISKSRSLLGSGRVLQAVSLLDEAMKRDPQVWEIWFLKGEANWQLGDKEEALNFFDRALDLAEDSSIILGRKGKLHFELENLEEALACYDQALATNPRAADIWTEKGSLLIAMNHFEAALECINQSLEINPRSKEALYNQGLALFSLGFFAKAIGGLKKALAIDPEFGDAWIVIGDCYRESGNNEEAMKAYRTAIKIQPENMDAYLSCLLLMKEIGAFEEAHDLLDRALEIEPENSRLLLERAEVLFSLGAYQDSYSICELIVDMESDNDDAKLIMATITRWLEERERIFEKIYSIAPVSLQMAFDDINGLLCIFCNASDALGYLGDTEEYDYFKACLHFVEARYDHARHHIEKTLDKMEYVDESARLKRLIDEQTGQLIEAAPKKKGFFGAIFKKAEKETRPAEEHLLLGLAKLGARSYQEAREHLQQALEAEPKFHCCRFFIGKTFDLQGQGRTALFHYDDFVNHIPQSLGYWKERLATSHIVDPNEVEAIYHRWIGEFPRDSYPWIAYLNHLSENNYNEKIRIMASGLQKTNFIHWKDLEGTLQHWNTSGLLKLYLGRYREAEEAFSEALKVRNNDMTALMGLGKCLEGTRRYDEAIEHFKKVVSGEIFTKKEESDDLESLDSQFAEMKEREEAVLNACYVIADIYRKRHDYEPALEFIENALKKQPDSPVLKYKRAQIIANKGNFNEFTAYYNEIYQTHSQFIPVKVLRALTLAENQKFNDAIAELTTILSTEEINLTVLKDLAFCYIQASSLPNALSFFEKILSIYSQDFEVYLGKGIASYLMKDYDDAFSCFSKAVELNPADADLWQFMGAVMFHRKDYAESMKCWDRAIRHRSRFTQAWANKGAFFYHIGEFVQAQECADRALRLNQEYSPGWLCRALCQWKTGNIQDALRSVQRALALAPQNSRAWSLQGILEFYAGNFEPSFHSFDKAVQLDRQNVDFWHNRALTALTMKNMADARRSIDRALALNSRHFEALMIRYAFEKNFDENTPEHLHLAPAREVDPERFAEWQQEYEKSGDPLVPLKPLDSKEELFTLPVARPLISIEPLQLLNYLKLKQTI
jgi:tetratricopeptide (TPR) repeat protein